MPTSASTVWRSSRDRPDAVDDPDAGERDPGVPQGLVHDGRAGAGRALAAVDGAEVLEEHLGAEVVALAVDGAQEVLQRGRQVPREHGVLRRGASRDGRAGHRDARAPQCVAEEHGGGERGRLRGPPSELRAVDDQRRERRRLADEVARLPAGRRAARVVEGLVADDPSLDAPDPLRPHLRREPRERRRAQGRVAGALEHDVAAPRRAVQPAGAERHASRSGRPGRGGRGARS